MRSLIFLMLSVGVGCLFFYGASTSAQENWNDHFKPFSQPVEIEAPHGMKIYDRPALDAGLIGSITPPQRGVVAGYVESGGQRFYLTIQSYHAWLDSETPPMWLNFSGKEILPPMPRLLESRNGIDPDTGEEALIEIYETTVVISPSSAWPMASVDHFDAFFSARIDDSTEIGDDGWELSLTLLPNGDAIPFGIPFTEPSFSEMISGKSTKIRRLIARPSASKHTISGDSNGANILSTLRPGMVAKAAFHKGSIVEFSTGGDAWAAASPTSRLSIPAVKSYDEISFFFHASSMNGFPCHIMLTPDRIRGADYTDYSLIENMGAPFQTGIYNEKENQTGWTIYVKCDQTIEIAAPLYDGRGAPGMLELEGISLEPKSDALLAGTSIQAESGSGTTMTVEEFSRLPPPSLETHPAPAGWIPLTERKLGTIPEAQRMEETDAVGEQDGL